jgi:ferredoxin
MSVVCQHCNALLVDPDRHCLTCHMDVKFGQHGWVAVESPFDPDRRRPREMVACPTCLVRIGRSAAPEPEHDREYQEWRKRGAR